MIISYSKRFIFIHIYKTAGTSVTEVLAPYARPREKLERNRMTRPFVRLVNHLGGLHGNTWLNGVHKHATATEIKNYIGDRLFSRYFTFTFVRNPFDWQVSLYHYIKDSSWHPDFRLANSISFKEFVSREINRRAPTQSSFVIDKGEVILDYIGKMENIENDMEVVCNKIGIKYSSVPNLNRSKRNRNYMEYYDEELQNSVLDYYDDDFRNFGYGTEK